MEDYMAIVPRLEFQDNMYSCTNGEHESVWRFLDKSLQFHRAPVLESLCIQLGKRCPIDVDVADKVANAVDRCVRKLVFNLKWSEKPTSMPKSLYTCETLMELELHNKIYLDVPSSVCLPSLTKLFLVYVVYKDEVSMLRLLSSCPVLRKFHVFRCPTNDDNVKKCSVKVPSLEEFSYANGMSLSHGNTVADMGPSLVIDCPALTSLYIFDASGDSFAIGNMPHIDEAIVTILCNPDKNFFRYLSTATYLSLSLTNALVMSGWRPNYFSKLVSLSISPYYSGWLEPLMLMLKTIPKLKSLEINTACENIPLLWNKPDHVPGCLSSHLEVFEWVFYEGKKEEKEFVEYILANSKYLKSAKFILSMACGLDERKKLRNELNCMFTVSPLCQISC